MKKIRNIIILVIIIIVILIIAIMLLNKKHNGASNNNKRTEVIGTELTEIYEPSEEEVKKQQQEAEKYLNKLYDKTSYYDIKVCLKNYLEKVKQNDKQAILSMLSKNYIEENKITTQNVGKYVFTYKGDVDFDILDFYQIQDSSVKSYAVYGTLLNTENKFKDIYFIINLNKVACTFSIEFIDKVDKLSDVKNREIASIEKNDYNTYNFYKITDEHICQDYIQKIKILSLAKPDILYSLLNKEYREARFDGLNDFKNYINENKEKIASVELVQYAKEKDNKTTIYICKDKKGSFYIINEKAFMDFDIMLDSYTVDLPQTLTAYEKAEENEKLTMNVERIVMAINDGNYKYLYNILETDFKKKNFPTQDSLRKYLKNKFYKNNKINGDITITQLTKFDKCVVNIADFDNTEKSVQATFYIYQGEKADFKLAFKID